MRKHPVKKNPEYWVWHSMKARCTNKNRKDYQWYGKRGISFCESWAEFENFFADMGERPRGCSLDRIDGDADYCKENCRWVSKTENSRTRNSNKLTAKDVLRLRKGKMRASEVARKYSITSGHAANILNYRSWKGVKP